MTEEKKSVLGEVVMAARVSAPMPDPQRARNIILLLAGSVALMMTGFGIIMPVFARRLGEFGDGVEALGLMTMSFALSQLVASPVMGGLADRFGRRPLILVALAAFTAANIGYLLAPSTNAFIAVRTLAGAFTAGLFPAAMGVVADIMPENQRARWIGIVMGGYGVGFIFGPVLGGFLYDGWGFSAPFTFSAGLAFLAFIAAFWMVQETRPLAVRRREALRARRTKKQTARKRTLWETFPKPLYLFGTLLFIDFVGSFAFAFVEPQMVFYMYDELGWSTVQFGMVVGAYGLAMVFGQTALGQLSDKWGRKPLIIIGLMLSILFYAGLAVLNSFALMALGAVIAGLGSALVAPALSAFYLDITAEEHRSRVVGVKESSLALGGVLGPLLVTVVARLTTPQGVFWMAAGLIAATVLLAAFLLKEPAHTAPGLTGVQAEISRQRSMAAQASLRGITLRAADTRAARQQG